MRKFKGNTSKNARIKISYKGKKPTVRFSYPCKKHQHQGSMFGLIFILWILFAMIAMIVGSVVVSSIIQEPTPTEEENSCNEKIDGYFRNESFLEEVREGICGGAGKNTFYAIGEDFVEDISYVYNIPPGFFFVLLFTFIPPFLIYLPLKKQWSNVYPKYMAWMTKKKIKRFSPKEVLHDDKLGWYCEIPVFENIILNFDATKDFSKYLKEFEIEEHKLRFYKKRRKKAETVKGKYKPPKTFNEWIWYARFYFEEKPKTGMLEVLFK